MGYILPVPHYQYSDYQNRTIQPDRPSFGLEKIRRTSLEGRLDKRGYDRDQDRKDYQAFSERLYTPHQFHAFGVRKNHQATMEKILADLTGKGQNVNELI